MDSALRTPPTALGDHFDWRQLFRDFYDLSKPGIGFYSLLTTAASFWLASRDFNTILFIHTLIGTGLVTCGGGALNQVLEVDADSRMRRTENRPLPSGRISLLSGLTFGIATSLIGAIYLLAFAGALPGLLAIICLAGYLFVYTPLKKKTHLSTLIGAVPGAVPILIGWAAARGEIGLAGWVLFAILFLWQIPHFLAIAWMYRKDYARAGFPMLTVIDPEGTRAAFQAVSYSLVLIPVSLLPSLLRLTGPVYFVGALLAGILFALQALRTAKSRTNASAKQLLLASIVYLPVVLALIVLDKV
ncbi:MAG: heme o synthase [Bacteroidota bacterium]|nr:heme o synthase [Bacteroidota bacterium]MDP4232683.1 heme o synthase [Bacteroidota bacterium]MDP4243184.1 heme o synthase [Bacteroidota bacterium]MDP4287641.1 heme o synthase [Bacteroidota bacterium]